MKDVLRCREHDLLEVGAGGLADYELEHLVSLRGRGPQFFSEERIGGRWFCRFAGYAGAVSLPGGRTLEVLPKVAGMGSAASRGLVMRMLAAADIAPALEEAAADYAASVSLLEAYLAFAADLATRQVRLGLVHSYSREDLRLPMVRGRILVPRQLARLPERMDVHLVDSDNFVADTPVNRAIKAGVQWVARLSRSSRTVAQCREAVVRMDAIADMPARPSALVDALGRWASDGVLDRRHARLRPLLKVLRLVVAGAGSAPEPGVEALGPTLLFDMSRLFEALLASRLRTVAPGLDVRVQNSRAFDVGHLFRLKPDIVVESAGTPVMVLDAKWKRLSGHGDVDDADLRQALAYARVLRLSEATLVYPRLEEGPSWSHSAEVADGSGVKIHLRQVLLGAEGWAAVDRELAALLGGPLARQTRRLQA